MVYKSKNEELKTSLTGTKKLAHGPYRATKLWNGIVREFREEMPCKKHRRHLKLYSSCFTATEAIDFLNELLKNNPNIGKDVTRQQTIQLLRKFLKNHVIEDVQGRWGSENFEDDGRLYRFPIGVTASQTVRQPLETIDGNVHKNNSQKNIKKDKRKSKSTTGFENNFSQARKAESESENACSTKSCSSSSSTTSWEHLKRPLPPVPTIPKCRVVSQKISEADVQDVWKKILMGRLRDCLQLTTLEDIVIENEINGDDIRHNATKVGKSGVVQVEKDEDIPYWALSAMTCLANWPNSADTGLPCYPGFEKDIFKAICEYYCGLQPTSRNNYGTGRRLSATRNQESHVIQVEPLLTFEHYELFTNIVCLIQPGSEKSAVEALRYSLLILPPVNRRKLHLIVRLMSKICSNPHLTRLGGHVSTRALLLQTFSRFILSCNEEVYLDELLAMRLVAFLIDHHSEIMKVPSDIEKQVEEKLAQLRRPEVRYEESCEEIPYMHYVLAANHGTKARLRNKPHITRADRHKRKSADLMKSWDKLVTSIRNKPTNKNQSSSTEKSDSSDSDPYVHMGLRPRKDRKGLRGDSRHHRPRTRTVGNRYNFDPTGGKGTEPLTSLGATNFNESCVKPAKSCSDLCDIEPAGKLNEKSSDMGSSWNLRLPPAFGRPFSKLKKSKV